MLSLDRPSRAGLFLGKGTLVLRRIATDHRILLEVDDLTTYWSAIRAQQVNHCDGNLFRMKNSS